MKRTWIAIGLIIFLLAMCFTENILTDKIMSDLDAKLNKSISYVREGDYQKAMESSSIMIEQWSGKQKILSMFSPHNELDYINKSFAQLPIKLEFGEYSEFLSDAMAVKSQIENVKNNASVSLENII